MKRKKMNYSTSLTEYSEEKKNDISLGVLPVTNKDDKDDKVEGMRDALAMFRDALPIYVEMMKNRAVAMRALYEALIASGFSPEQAMEIVKAKDV